MRIQRPKNDASLLNQLHHFNLQAQKTDLAMPSLSAELFQEISEAHTNLQLHHSEVTAREQACKTANAAHINKNNQLIRRLRLAYNIVRFTSKEPDFPVSLLEAFGLKKDGSFPAHKATFKYPLEMLREVLQANSLAQAQGYDLLTGPTAAEFEQHRSEWLALLDARTSAKTALQSAREQLKESRTTALLIITKVSYALRQATTGMTPLAHRNVMRAYGFTYQGDRQPTTSEQNPITDFLADPTDQSTTNEESQTHVLIPSQAKSEAQSQSQRSPEKTSKPNASSPSQAKTEAESQSQRSHPRTSKPDVLTNKKAKTEAASQYQRSHPRTSKPNVLINKKAKSEAASQYQRS